MCGIFGLAVAGTASVPPAQVRKLLRRMFLLSESRGREAAGLAIASSSGIEVVKLPVPASELLISDEYRTSVDSDAFSWRERGLAVIGHARLVTNGMQGIDANNQPVVCAPAVVVHNGIIVNEDLLWREEPRLRKTAQVDTEVIAALLSDRLAQGHSLQAASAEIFARIYGEASIGVLLADRDEMLIATNTGSLYLLESPSTGVLAFVSELVIAQRIRREFALAIPFAAPRQVRAGEASRISIPQASCDESFRLADTAGGAARPAATTRAPRPITTNLDRVAERHRRLRRCTRCVLPETMPFIEFDEQGVCNYCRNYRPLVPRGRAELERVLERYRSRDGSPDCLVSFSGGRDSSYGLHLLKTEFGMNPIAYTYDWGMVTDLARRNQARLCGKLGVEHIWVSADIRRKRANVGANVRAWLRRPDLGMIPLFMAGDKQFMYHANRLMNETGIRLMAYSTNHYERTDFKVGFCGVRPASTDIRLNRVSAAQKVRLALHYLKNFLLNPAYINRSLGDTFGAFWSYYFINQDFLYLFDHLDWNEEVINRTLIDTYDWELAKDTTTTWRIGDGTAPFYNYIYQTVAGFSEYETFRSNQIREGVMTREEALELIERENVPRMESIQEYCRVIGVDFDRAMRVINRIPKFY